MEPRTRVSRRGKAVGKRAVRGKIASLMAGEDGSFGFLGRRKPGKSRVTLFLDADVLAWIKGQGPRCPRTINWELRKVMAKER